MSQHFKRMFLTAIAALLCGAVFAQKVTFEASAPSVVMTGEIFRVEFAVNAEANKFMPPNISNFEVMAGPTESRGKSISIINGDMTSSINVTFTYVLVGQKAGTFTIPAAKVEVDGQTYTSQPLAIEVVGDDSGSAAGGTNNNSGSSQQRQQNQQSVSKPKTTISADDLFVRVLVNKTNVYKGQPIKATFKLYTRVPLSGVESTRFPAFNGFWTQEIANSGKASGRETVNSKVYDTHIIREYLLFPQQAGKLSIEQFDMTVVAQIMTQSRRQSVFDDFFGGGASVQEIRKKLASSPINITVKELPAGAPDSFSGAVGNFTMSSDRSSASISANSSSTFTIKISGDGNLPLIQAPKLTLPGSFEQYNIKTTESLKTTNEGIVGYRQFEYPIIARAEGSYQIQPVYFSFFNPKSGQYVTLNTGDLSLEVLPDSTGNNTASRGMVSGLTKEDIKVLGQDIRFIKIGAARLSAKDSLFMGSVWYFLILFAILGVFVFLLIYLQKRIKEMQNSVLVKGKRANEVALQRLRAAKGYMEEHNQRGFYEEMLRALWGYMSDKLNIPVANLTKDNVREELLKRSIHIDQANAFIGIITECEYAQYSPDGSGQMNDTYNNAVNSISKFESSIKK